MGALPKLQHLFLSNNKIGAAGMMAFADAVGKGALPALKDLQLSGNQIGDIGLSALATALGSGALASLNALMLGGNKIGDAGMTAFADAVGNGALAVPEGVHIGFTCDGSGICPIRGVRYHLSGEDYDLCASEYAKLSEHEQQNYEHIEPTEFAMGALAPGATVSLGNNNTTETGKQAMRDAANARDLSVRF